MSHDKQVKHLLLPCAFIVSSWSWAAGFLERVGSSCSGSFQKKVNIPCYIGSFFAFNSFLLSVDLNRTQSESGMPSTPYDILQERLNCSPKVHSWWLGLKVRLISTTRGHMPGSCEQRVETNMAYSDLTFLEMTPVTLWSRLPQLFCHIHMPVLRVARHCEVHTGPHLTTKVPCCF